MVNAPMRGSRRRLGQHFLVDREVARRIAQAVGAKSQEVILEIGCGQGILTKFFLEQGAQVYGIELDPRWAAYLWKHFGHYANFRLIQGDALKLDWTQWASPSQKIRVVGNIPYYITSRLLFKILGQREIVQDVILMVQKEVAERIISAPGNKNYGVLSILCQMYDAPRLLFDVPRRVFQPPPRVDSAVIQMIFGEPRYRIPSEADFLRLLKTCFAQRRKMLRNSLKKLAYVNVSELGTEGERRPEELSVEEWIELYHKIFSSGGQPGS